MTESTTRLHITPLTPDILPSVVPASLQASATDISYHTLPTFPENSYGYITLPEMAADKIKKKLNGSILKGKKFKVETARSSKRQRNDEEVEIEPEVDEKKKKKSKKRKSEDQVLDGYELPSDRKVKRGWTEPPGAKKDKRKTEKKKSKDDKKEKPQPKSKYTEKPECLFRTTVPPNRSEDTDDKKAKKKKKSSESVVHEFTKTVTHPSFLRSTEDGQPETATFDDEKGWVDTTGTVKEAPSQKARKADFQPGQVAGTKLKGSGRKSTSQKEKARTPESSSESEDWTSSSGSSSDESLDSESEDSSSSDESSDDASESPVKNQASNVESFKKALESASTPESNASGSESEEANKSTKDAENAEDAEGAEDTKDSSPKEVHPLEALFKRSAPTESNPQPEPSADAGFSFFGNNDFDSEDEAPPEGLQPPFTPFNMKDWKARGERSAAPTPDTALPTRHRNWSEEDNMEDDEDVSIDTPVSKLRGVDTGMPKEETEFAKWFWENRGENNRAWKKRRRDAAKEQRQRENRKKGMKGKS